MIKWKSPLRSSVVEWARCVMGGFPWVGLCSVRKSSVSCCGVMLTRPFPVRSRCRHLLQGTQMKTLYLLEMILLCLVSFSLQKSSVERWAPGMAGWALRVCRVCRVAFRLAVGETQFSSTVPRASDRGGAIIAVVQPCSSCWLGERERGGC